MIILGIECASLVASVAVSKDGRVLAESTLHDKRTHSETLLPMCESVLKEAGISLSDLDYIAVSAGPGSFTGLRIGATTGKGLAYALNIPMLAVPTMDAMAFGATHSEMILCPLFDARRSQVYTGLYSFEQGQFVIHETAMNISIDETIEKAEQLSKELQKPVCYFGDGLLTYSDYLKEHATNALILSGEELYQHASPVCLYGEVLAKTNETVSAMEFTPIYLRKSQAEQEREAMGLSIEPADLSAL